MEKNTKVELTPIKEPEPLLPEREARFLVNEMTHICTIAQSAFELSELSKINRSANFYVEEMLRVFKDYNIIVD